MTKSGFQPSTIAATCFSSGPCVPKSPTTAKVTAGCSPGRDVADGVEAEAGRGAALGKDVAVDAGAALGKDVAVDADVEVGKGVAASARTATLAD